MRPLPWGSWEAYLPRLMSIPGKLADPTSPPSCVARGIQAVVPARFGCVVFGTLVTLGVVRNCIEAHKPTVDRLSRHLLPEVAFSRNLPISDRDKLA